MTVITDKKPSTGWGGARAGAGRKPTGHIKTNFSVTPEEKELLHKYLEALRNGEPPILQEIIKSKMQTYHDEALKQASRSRVNRPRMVLQFYKEQALGELVGILINQNTFNKRVAPLKAEVERQEREALQKWEEERDRNLYTKHE